MMKKRFLSLFLVFGFVLFACQPNEANTSTDSTPLPTNAPMEETNEEATNTISIPETDLNATLQEVEGSVEAKDIDEADFSTAQTGRIIQVEGQVRTLEDGFTRVDLSTGTLIRMAPLSYFTLVENKPVNDTLLTRIKLEIGQIWVVLNGGSLDVETPSGQASVRGSYMMVEIDPETQEAFISCLEGCCLLENPAGVVELFDGERSRLLPPDMTGGDFIMSPIEEMSERDFAEWLFFTPEAEDIFPFLAEKGILPWDEWEEYIPDEGENWFEFEESFPDEPFLDGDRLNGDGALLDGDGTLLDGDGTLLDGDGTLLDGVGDGSNLPGGGENLPGGGDDGDGIGPRR